MRRAYVEAHMSLSDAFRVAARWAGTVDTIIGPSTRAIEASPWLEHAGARLGTIGNRHTRFTARPAGLTIAWCLHLDEILDLEHRNHLSGLIAVRASTDLRPWVTAHEAEHLGGEVLKPVPEAGPAIKAMVEGITGIAVSNQGLIDPRERSEAVQALIYFHDRGHELNPSQLIVEAIRNGWPGNAPVELSQLARDITAGKRLRYQRRLRPEILVEWANQGNWPGTGASEPGSSDSGLVVE